MSDQVPERARVDFAVPRGVLTRAKPCRACSKPILFFNPTGGKTPLDVESAIDDPKNPVGVRLESHFAHCPKASEFRRPRSEQS
jgi:hypothetical protein